MAMRNFLRALVSKNSALVRKLKIILDRSSWIDINLLSNNSSGHKDDGLPSDRDP